MEKTPRYTASEKRLLLKLIANQKDIIEKKKTDAFTNRSKENAWQVITKSYNNYVKFKRTTKQLRQLYKNMKYAANVNSTSTSNLTEMLEILDMQILNDPNIKSGENMLLHNNLSNNTPSSVVPQQTHNLQTKIHHNSNINTNHNFLLKSLVKAELFDDDDFDDEDLSMTQQIDSELDFTKLQASQLINCPNESPNLFNSNDIDDDLDMDDIDNDDDTNFPLNLQNTFNNHQYNNATTAATTKSSATNNKNTINTKEMLISIAIEERRRKIELLETQINYWKTLTEKIENCGKICCCKIENFHNRSHLLNLE